MFGDWVDINLSTTSFLNPPSITDANFAQLCPQEDFKMWSSFTKLQKWIVAREKKWYRRLTHSRRSIPILWTRWCPPELTRLRFLKRTKPCRQLQHHSSFLQFPYTKQLINSAAAAPGLLLLLQLPGRTTTFFFFAKNKTVTIIYITQNDCRDIVFILLFQNKVVNYFLIFYDCCSVSVNLYFFLYYYYFNGITESICSIRWLC